MAAGVSYDEARTIALADQYVDNNPLTEPLNSSSWLTKIGSIFVNQERLLSYHFVLSGSDGKTLGDYNNANLSLPGTSPSPQLTNLLNASLNAPTDCGKLQFFGEYLHAFEDTFSHRDKNNKPYDAEQFGLGVGHGLALSEPDYTYDNNSNGWGVRAKRTLEMEEEVYNTLLAYHGDSQKARSWADVKAVMAQFNAITENEEDGKNFKDKFALLNATLKAWEYKAINTDKTTRDFDFSDPAKEKYDSSLAAKNRDKNLCDKDGNRLKKSEFTGTILPETTCPK